MALMRSLLWSDLAAMLLAGCRPTPWPVQLVGGRADVDRLVGDWAGEYSSAETGRRGTITFRLKAGGDTAYGEVVMIPRSGSGGVTPSDQESLRPPRVRATDLPESLRITFVRAELGAVTGRLDPYRDPECECQVVTQFRGAMTDSTTFEGTFITQGVGSRLVHTGRWRAVKTGP